MEDQHTLYPSETLANKKSLIVSLLVFTLCLAFNFTLQDEQNDPASTTAKENVEMFAKIVDYKR